MVNIVMLINLTCILGFVKWFYLLHDQLYSVISPRRVARLLYDFQPRNLSVVLKLMWQKDRSRMQASMFLFFLQL